MSSRRRHWLAIAGIAALALGGLVARPGPSDDREQLGGLDPAGARGEEDCTLIQGKVVGASLAGRPPLDYFLFVPAGASRDVPLLVAIHGISGNAREQAESFAPLAAKHGFSVVAPRFDERGYDDYQRLGRRGRGARADAALDRLIDELERRGVAPKEVFLFGYSGGGQFAHRYVMAHPERVRAGIVTAAGWYTFPDPSSDYPYGIRVAAELPGVRLLPSAFLRVPMLAVVGGDDRKRDENLRRSSVLDRRQGRNRVERATRWVGAMRTAAIDRAMQPRVELATLEGAGHSFADSMRAGLGEVVVEYLVRWRRPLEESGNADLRASEPSAPGGRGCVARGR